MTELVTFALVLLVVVVVVLRSVKMVAPHDNLVIERLGRYHRTLTAGVHVIVPFIDRVAAVVDMREQVLAIKGAPIVTHDNYLVEIDLTVFHTVTNAQAATYEIAVLEQGLEHLAITTLRNVVGSMDLGVARDSRFRLNDQLQRSLANAVEAWGTRINRAEVLRIERTASVPQSRRSEDET